MRQAQQNPNAYRQLLQQTIQEKNIGSLFANPAILDQICAQAPGKVQQLSNSWKIEPEIAQDIVKLSLFDIIVFCDDSGSMAFEVKLHPPNTQNFLHQANNDAGKWRAYR